jgi:hypothetical protein
MQKRTMNETNFDKIKDVGDGVAVFVTVGTIASFLPAIAALFTIFWTGLRIYESDTVQRLLGRK